MNITRKVTGDFRRVLLATMFFGATSGIFLSTLNNYLSDVHGFDAGNRGWLEFPRELPGFLIFIVMGFLLAHMRESRIAALAMVATAAGALGLAFLSPGVALLVVWIVVWSMGDHIIFTVEGPLGLKLAKRGGEGRRLGQLGGARNLGVILGVGSVWLMAKFIGDRYDLFYLLAGLSAMVAGVLYFRLTIGKEDASSRRMVYRREYHIFYAISALFGIRKQIFMVFGTWVLVSLHDVPVSTIALLYFVASALGVLLRPLLGDVIDWLGERKVLATDEIMLVFVCMIYGFASDIFSSPWDLWVLYGAYMLDHILFALRIARTTYLKKIAVDPADITPTISLGITIDHVVAMTLPVLSGLIWERYGHQWVFVLAGAIALGGFFICLRIRIPEQEV
ncbi:MAG: MFS transporter [Candidatus Krumholzibacteria bacterium]|nr:MFS transporter [Candidatus Krumholzibacteria bacterium]